ncbi:MAG TPA: hypothetical protein VGK74_12240 [Symbiobacteriaceae bacterium]|jgi:hypothetical protein
MSTGQTGIPLEIVAAITATLAAVLDLPVDSFAVTRIQAEPASGPRPSLWGKAGVLESHLVRRQFGIRTR